jgi:hypothetical protein
MYVYRLYSPGHVDEESEDESDDYGHDEYGDEGDSEAEKGELYVLIYAYTYI